LQWSIGALLSFNLKIANLSNLTSVFSVKLILNQTISIISPRDIGSGEPRVSTRSFTVLEEGKRPTTAYPDRRNVALWRGKGAGGTDDADASSDMAIDKRCRLPDDNIARPSTLPGVVTPISVSHSLSLEVTFSVWGEDDRGRKMEHTTHGGLRALRVTRPLFVPSVSCNVA
jgi:hypothetical protein